MARSLRHHAVVNKPPASLTARAVRCIAVRGSCIPDGSCIATPRSRGLMAAWRRASVAGLGGWRNDAAPTPTRRCAAPSCQPARAAARSSHAAVTRVAEQLPRLPPGDDGRVASAQIRRRCQLPRTRALELPAQPQQADPRGSAAPQNWTDAGNPALRTGLQCQRRVAAQIERVRERDAAVGSGSADRRSRTDARGRSETPRAAGSASSGCRSARTPPPSTAPARSGADTNRQDRRQRVAGRAGDLPGASDRAGRASPAPRGA